MPHELRTPNRESPALDVRAALREGLGRLREAGVPSHTLAAELLLMHVLGRERAWLYAHPEERLDIVIQQRYFELVARRCAGTPTQYLTGKQEFWGFEFEVTPDVLIPRPETEHVVEVALERIGPPRREDEAAKLPRGSGLRIADVGTGSGCLAVALARELPGAQVFATDISEAALAVAQRNARRHGVASRIKFVQANLLDALLHESQVTSHPSQEALRAGESRLFNLIVSNPPYVGRGEAGELPREVREHEPAQALFAGERGVEIYPALIGQAEKLLRPGGALVVELAYNALPGVRPLFDSAAWTAVRVTNDLAGIPRVLSAARA